MIYISTYGVMRVVSLWVCKGTVEVLTFEEWQNRRKLVDRSRARRRYGL